MKEFLAKAWAWLDGNKTIICLGGEAILQKLVEFKIIENSNIVQFGSWLLLAAGTGALVQHIQKGYFTTEKGG